MPFWPSCIATLIFVASSAHTTHARFFSPKPVYLDERLGGWVEPIRTLTFQAGCGELYYVVGVYLGERRELNVVSRSQVTLRVFNRRHLNRFAQKLADALADVVEHLAEEGTLDGVVLTFYCTFLRGNILGLEVYECCLPAHAFGSLGPVPLRIIERRIEVLPPP